MAIKSFVNYRQAVTISSKCRFCNGRCLVSGNPKKTQERAHKLFRENQDRFNGDASIPNGCIPNSDGESKCPKEQGLI